MGRALPNFETQQNDVLGKCIAVFGALRGVSGDCLTGQIDRFLSKKNLRLREGLHHIGLQAEYVTR
jgi:hypothetical protein